MLNRLLFAAPLLLLSSLPGNAQDVPPAAASWLRCAALGALAEKGAPDKVAKDAAAEIRSKYEELFGAYIAAMQGSSANPKIVRQRVKTSVDAMIEKRRLLNKEEQPVLIACQQSMERLTKNIAETVQLMVSATPKPTETVMSRDMWATCSAALGWAVQSGMTGDPQVRDAAVRYRQLFQSAAKQQGLSDEQIKKGLADLQKVAATKSANELKSAVASCVRQKP